MSQEKRSTPRSVRRLRVNLKFIITVTSTLIAIIYSGVQIVLSNQNYTFSYLLTISIIVGVSIAYLILLSLQEGQLVDNIFKLVGKFHKEDYAGDWQIKITYNNKETGKETIRTGKCQFEDTISGLRIDGGNILNSNNEIEVDDWNSNNVEILEYHDYTKLIYTYFIYEKDAINQSKIGLAILTRDKSNKPFSGTFRDFDVADGKKVKEGTVTIYR